MKFIIPILVEAKRDGERPGDMHVLRPLFMPEPAESDRDLRKATGKLAQTLQKDIKELCVAGKHRRATRFLFDPGAELHQHSLQLDLHDQSFRGHFPIITFRKFQRRLGLCPLFDDLWFEIARGEADETRAAEVLGNYIRRRQREGDMVRQDLAPFERKTRRWISRLEIDVATQQRLTMPNDDLFSILGGQREFDGEAELRQVGRCQDWLYPGGLRRAAERDELLQQLTDSLQSGDDRPVLLVGSRLVGKTALIHEYVFREVAKRSTPFAPKNNTWLLSPQRLISGMSFVGGWEERLLSILRHAKKRNHLLYIDDVIGLYYAGISASSNLCAADVLKPYVERRDVRLLAEMTPEAYRVFQERDRGFADLFEVIRCDEPGEATTYRILLACMRTLELTHRCQFGVEVIPTVIDITRRYQRDAAMPGKAAVLLEHLAVSNVGKAIDREKTLESFRSNSGLDHRVVDTRARMPRKEIIEQLQTHIVGQREALEALTDVISIAKARLNDPQRPLSALLFVGPTGVGKTETAKALARYMFSDEARMLRFDMNEFVAPDAAARLVGTPAHPEGTLTSSVRRQPFSVILFDEIEKAHPDVFDLLLQVLGEGRLTDSLGRTTDFGNSILVMTSNLGTAEAQSGLGFQDRDRSSSYIQAVESFFRPEFFNRLDRIVPFQPLSRDELATIASRLLNGVLAREGLVRRKCSIQIEASAVECVIDRGYHPVLGARAMKRAIQQELVEPVADQLAAIAPNMPTLLQVAQRDGQLSVDVAELKEASTLDLRHRPALFETRAGWLKPCGAFLQETRQFFQSHRPQRSPSDAGAWFAKAAGTAERQNDSDKEEANTQYYDYLASMELLESCRTLLGYLQAEPDGYDLDPAPVLAPRPARAKSRRARIRGLEVGGRLLRSLVSADDINQFWVDVRNVSEEVRLSDPQRNLVDLMDRVAFLHLVRESFADWNQDRVLFMCRTLGAVRAPVTLDILALCQRFVNVAASLDADDEIEMGLTFDFHDEQHDRWKEPGRQSLRNELLESVVEGPNALQLLRLVEGTHLVTTRDNQLVPIQTVAWPMQTGEKAEAAAERCILAHQRARDLADNPDSGLSDPLSLKPVIWLMNEREQILIDVRTGFSYHTVADDTVRGAVISLLRPPPFLVEDRGN